MRLYRRRSINSRGEIIQAIIESCPDRFKYPMPGREYYRDSCVISWDIPFEIYSTRLPGRDGSAPLMNPS